MSELIDTRISCPYCGEQINVVVEVLEECQEYIEDCQVCCRPIIFDITADLTSEFDGNPTINVRTENDTY
ncbi:CPXCG motif-containing cysteine-rich protein [Teredinibacter waterburyi]|uniref:CPXCG motif-containing cysteine-rich protein n=1 Tax=Teredinibacter waterburyi TaxID=1500538 RepID=UPI00165FC29A|nr:CPXCG motif-containing cysteine-rich protein [Teredinibacter waterburyi]